MLLIHCLIVLPMVCEGSVFAPCFVMNYLVSVRVLQSSLREQERWLLYFNCFLDVL